MARTNADLDIKITASGLEKMIQELTKAQEGLQKLGAQYKGASNSAKLMNDIITDGNKALSLIKTKMSSDGTMDLASAKSLTDILQRITNQTMELDNAEKKRLSPEKYKAQHEALVENNADYQKILKTLEKLNAQQTLLQDKKNNLEKGDSDLIFQELGIKGSAGAKKVLPKISSLTDKQLNNLIPSDNARESTKEAFYNKYRVGKESNETVRSNVKSAMEVELKRRQEIKRISLEQIEIEKKITAHSAERATHEQKIEALKKEGVTTAPGMAKYTEQFFSTSKAINDATVAASNANKSVVQLDSSVANNTSTFQQATKAILSSRVVYNTLRRVLNEAIRTVREMDKALTGMTAVTGKAREEVHKLIPELKKLAQETSSTMTDVANLTTEYLRQGRSMEDALELAKETAKAAQIAEISTSDSLTYMTSAINGFNLAASDAAHVSDVFANVAAKTATDYEQLAVALSKVSAQANLAGMSMEYTTALLAKGIETTQEAPESIGTALKTIIARMRELTDYNKVLEDGTSINKVERALASAGISLRDQNGAFRDLEQIFNDLGPKWETLNTMQQQAIAQAVAGTRQQSRFVAIMQDWDRTLETVAISEESAGAAAYQYSKMAEGLTATLTNLTTSWQGFTTSLIDTDFLISILRTATEFLNTLSNATPFLRNIMVIGGSILGYTKLSNMYAEQSYIKNLQIAALRKQIGGVEVHNAKSLKKQLIIESAKLEILKAEKLEYGKQELIVNTLKAQQKTLLVNKAQSLAMDIQILRNKKSELTHENYMHLLSSNSLLTKAAILRLNQASLETTIKTEAAEVAGLKRYLVTAEMDLRKLMTNEEITEEKRQQLIIEQQSTIENLKNNITEKEELLLLKQQALVKKKQMKDDLATFGKRALLVAGIAAAVAAIVVIVKQINKLTKVQENALKSIEEHSNNIYELNNKKNDLSKLIEEYEKLNNTVSKTADQEQRMLDIEKQLHEQGIDGSGNDLLAMAKTKEETYNIKIDEERNGMISDTLAAFKDSAEKIDFFKNSTFENAFKKKYQMQLETNLEKEMADAVAKGIITIEQYNYARQTGQKLISNLDSKAIAEEAWARQGSNYGIADDIGRTTGYGTIGSIAGAAGGAALVAGGAMALSSIGIGAAAGSAVPVVGTIIGAAVGAVVGIVGGVLVAAKENSQRAADEAMEEQTKLMAEYTQQIQEFSIATSDMYDASLSEQYKRIKEEMESGNYSERTLEAITEMYSTVISIFENPKIASLVKQIEEKLEEEAKDFVKNISSALEGLGENSLEQALITVTDALNAGASSVEAAAALYVDMANENSVYFKEEKEKWESNVQDQIKSLERLTDTKRGKKELKRLAKSQDTTYEAVRDAKLAELETLRNSTYENSDARKELLDKTYSLITSDRDILSLEQSLKGLDSAKKNMIEIDKALNEGTLSLEQMIALSGDLGEEFYEVLNTEGLQGVRDLITDNLIGPYDTYLKQIDNFIEGQKALVAAEKDQNSAAANAARQTIQLAESYRKEYLTFNEVSLEAYMIRKKISALEESSDKSNIKNIQELIKLKKKQYDVEEERLNDYFKNYPKEMKLIKQIREGTISVEEAWAQVADSQNFKRLLENTESYFDSLEEKQKEVVDSYKELLQAEQEALKNSLDKRKELYEKYFDTIDRESEEEDFVTEQSKLQRAIASLSTATDANSLAKLKEYQEQLLDLQDEYLQSQKEAQRDNLLETLDNQEESMNQYYEERLNNEKALWDEIAKYYSIKAKEFVKIYTSGGTNASVTPYATGGLVDYTGLAMVHGSKSNPEAFLNANQTAMFEKLALNLEHYYSRNSSTLPSDNAEGGLVIENININVDGVLNADNVQSTANSLADAFYDRLQKTGISLNKR